MKLLCEDNLEQNIFFVFLSMNKEQNASPKSHKILSFSEQSYTKGKAVLSTRDSAPCYSHFGEFMDM